MRAAVGVPNVGIFAHPRALIRLAVTAEEAGWDGFFLWDHLLYREPDWPVVDPLVAMGAIAARTERLRLGLTMLALPRRNPVQTAKDLATLDVLSNGRLIVGAGIGSLAREYEAFGATADARVRADLLDESLDVITALWSGRPVVHHGDNLTVDGVQMLPRPAQAPRPNIWCGGRWPARRPFRRAARYDGVMPTHQDFGLGTTMPPDALAEIVQYVSTHRVSSQPFDVAIEGGTEDGTDRDRPRAYASAGATWWVEALGWWRGDLDAALRRAASGPPAG